MLNTWVLDNRVTEIVMKERQFWNFVFLQPLAEKPWTTFMGRPVYVPDMPENAQKYLGPLRFPSGAPDLSFHRRLD